MQVKKLLAKDINQNYLDTLNDSFYMQFSRNSSIKHSYESQSSYVNSFNTGLSQPNSILFGVFEENQLVGTMTASFDMETKSANLGILIFRDRSSTGIGKKALSTLTNWVRARFPLFSIEVGTNKANLAMTKLALSCGYVPRIGDSSEFIFFDFPAYNFEGVDERLSIVDGKVLFFGTDTGGVESTLEFYVRSKADKSFFVQGNGREVLDYYGVTNLIESAPNLTDFTSLMFSTGADSSTSQSLQEAFRLAKKASICILDNWVNYRHRFNLPNGLLPDIIVTTNEIAFSIAKKMFSDSKILLTPDYRLQRLRHITRVDIERTSDCVLLVLEPERAELEGLGAITKSEILNSIEWAKSLAKEFDLARICVRLHPVMESFKELQDVIEREENVTLSEHSRVEGDLPSCKAVIGFSSSVLYLTAKLGIPTYSLLRFSDNSWLGRCQEIMRLGLTKS